MRLVSGDPQKRTLSIPKGLYEPLLCKRCEQIASGYEQYCETLLFRQSPPAVSHGAYLQFEGVDYRQLKLFQMHLLWRTSVSKRPEFNNVQLGPYQEPLRVMLLNNDPGEPWQYPCVLTLLVNDGIDPLSFTLMPIMRKHKGYRLYSFVACGVYWLYSISSQRPSPCFQDMVVDASGRLKVYRKSATFFLKPVAKVLGDAGKFDDAEP